MRLMFVVGARPQIIKSAPVIREARKHDEIELQLVHTGQHYDFEMSKIFFDEMALPEPLANLGVGSGSHAWQTGSMMIELEKAMVECLHRNTEEAGAVLALGVSKTGHAADH